MKNARESMYVGAMPHVSRGPETPGTGFSRSTPSPGTCGTLIRNPRVRSKSRREASKPIVARFSPAAVGIRTSRTSRSPTSRWS